MTVFVQFLKIQPHSAEEILFPMNAMGIVAAITPGVFSSLKIYKEKETTEQLLSLSDGNIKVWTIKESTFLKGVKFVDIF